MTTQPQVGIDVEATADRGQGGQDLFQEDRLVDGDRGTAGDHKSPDCKRLTSKLAKSAAVGLLSASQICLSRISK